MTLTEVEGIYSVYRFAPGTRVPSCLLDTDSFISITRTADELSVVCEGGLSLDQMAEESGWSVLKVEGPLDFGMTGVVASITGPLGAASISVFVISTYDTDYLLVKRDRLARAATVLRGADFTVLLL